MSGIARYVVRFASSKSQGLVGESQHNLVNDEPGYDDRGSAPRIEEQEDTSEEVDSNLEDTSCLGSVNKVRNFCGKVVNSSQVQSVIVLLIAVNAIMMGIATFDFVEDDPDMSRTFELADMIFLIIFTIELGFQLFYHGHRLFLDGWLVFDFVIVITSWSFSSAQIIRAFRIFRALRLVTRIKVMKNLILALFDVMPRMAAIALLLFLIFYIFAVMFTQLFKDMYSEGQTEENYFSRMDGTFFTLFQIMTLDAWSDIAREVMDTYTWAWVPFIAFVIISGFIVVNLIIAVICDAISALHDEDKARLHGYGGTEEDHGEGTGLGEESEHNIVSNSMHCQLEALEVQVEHLTRMQEETMKTLELLAMHVKTQKQQ